MTALEYLGRCPVCRSAEREPAYRGATDGVFGTSGEWDYWTCVGGILYLDPRPGPEALAEAYED